MKTSYALCIGVKIGGEYLAFPHNYVDGKEHEFSSDGICPNCLRIRSEYKIRKKEEDRQREKGILEKFTEGDIKELEGLALRMYGGK